MVSNKAAPVQIASENMKNRNSMFAIISPSSSNPLAAEGQERLVQDDGETFADQQDSAGRVPALGRLLLVGWRFKSTQRVGRLGETSAA